MNCFLIDFENVKSAGLKGIERLTQNDDVFIFYSDYANSITFDIHHKMNLSTANIQFFKSASTGKNALDFQLVSYLGYLIAQKRYRNYFVITDDRGFESAIKFWKEFFKQNRFTDLEISRFRSVQDAIDKRPVAPRQNLRKNAPTIPTVEAELELQQIKAENVIVDRDSPQLEKHIERNMVDSSTASTNRETPHATPTSGKPRSFNQTATPTAPPVKETPADTTTNTAYVAAPSAPTPQDKPSKNKPIFVNRATSSTDADAPTAVAQPSTTENRPKPPKNRSVPTTNPNATTTNPATNSTTNPPGKKAFNQAKKNPNPNTNPTPNATKKPQGGAPSQEVKPPKKPTPDAPKPAFAERTTKPFAKDTPAESRATQPKNVFKESQPKPKSFVFGKVNLSEDVSAIESFQKKQPAPAVKEKQTVPASGSTLNVKATDLQENIAPKAVDSTPKDSKPPVEPTKVDRAPADRKPSTTDEAPKKDAPTKKAPRKKPSHEATTEAPAPQATTAEPPKSDRSPSESAPNRKAPEASQTDGATAHKVGRPRVRPARDESRKPKNNKKFQGEIPGDKLDAMLERVSKFGGLESSSREDTVMVCKIVAFSSTKQECYQTLMSYFGKFKGVEVYKSVKQEYDALKNLFLN